MLNEIFLISFLQCKTKNTHLIYFIENIKILEQKNTHLIYFIKKLKILKSPSPSHHLKFNLKNSKGISYFLFQKIQTQAV